MLEVSWKCEKEEAALTELLITDMFVVSPVCLCQMHQFTDVN